MSATSEEVVLLDEDGHAIGTADKNRVHGLDTPLHLAFSCYVFDRQHQLLITQRAWHKVTWPGEWTNSVCGHPAAGESLVGAVRRRARQELGITLTDLRLVLPRFRYRCAMANGTTENEMCPVFVALTTDEVWPDPAEVASHAWVPWVSFRDDVRCGRTEVSPWCVSQVVELPEHPGQALAADPTLLPPAARPDRP